MRNITFHQQRAHYNAASTALELRFFLHSASGVSPGLAAYEGQLSAVLFTWSVSPAFGSGSGGITGTQRRSDL